MLHSDMWELLILRHNETDRNGIGRESNFGNVKYVLKKVF